MMTMYPKHLKTFTKLSQISSTFSDIHNETVVASDDDLEYPRHYKKKRKLQNQNKRKTTKIICFCPMKLPK